MTVEAYCDGSVGPAQITSLTSSILNNSMQVGRILVLIPALDLGYLEKPTDYAVNLQGNPDPLPMEILAVRRAHEILDDRRMEDYLVLTDNIEAVNRYRTPHVKWISRRLNYAGFFLESIRTRHAYLRHSSGKVRSRHPPDSRQKEIFRLFNAEKERFPLSESFIWRKILRRIQVDPKLDLKPEL